MNKNAFDVAFVGIEMFVRLNTRINQTDGNQQKHKKDS